MPHADEVTTARVPDDPPIIGREADLQALTERSAARFITLTGPGGCGKTTLARAFMDHHHGPDGAWFVDLAGVADAAGIGSAMAATLELATAGASRPDTVIEAFLRSRSVLVVLDNLEQIPDAGSWISSFLDAAPFVRVLATSRVPTRGNGEVVVPVAGLSLPAGDSVGEVEASAAGALFLARARALGGFRLVDDADAAAVSTVLRRLDGLPLAIELAAGRTRLLSAASLLAHLEDPRVIARSNADPNDRHASLDAVIGWSLDLLSGEERELLRALAVLPDSFDAELAWALLPGGSAVDALETLVTAGLISPAREAAHRFRLLETIRSRVRREVDRAFEDETWQRFAAYMAGRADELRTSMWRGADQERAALAFRVERPSLEAAVDWWVEHDPGVGLPVFPMLRRFWWAAPDAQRPIRQLRALLERAAPDHPARAGALATLMMLIDRDEGGAAALALAPDVMAAVTSGTSVEDRRACYTALAQSSSDAGHWRDAGDWLLRVSEALDDPVERAQFAASGRAWVAIAAGDDAGAAAHIEAAIRASSAVGDDYNRSAHLFQLAVVQLGRGRLAAAREAAEAAFAIGPQATFAMDVLAISRARANALDAAWAALAQGWARAEREVRWDQLRMLDAAAVVLEASHRDDEAAVAHAVADRERRVAGWARWPPLARALRRSEQVIRGRLGEVAYRLARQRAAEVRVETLMREILASPGPVRSSGSGRRTAGPGELTAREVEVLALIGAGRNDQEIAEALFISPKTASVHATNIRSKLGAGSRLEVALHARSIGLEPPPPTGSR